MTAIAHSPRPSRRRRVASAANGPGVLSGSTVDDAGLALERYQIEYRGLVVGEDLRRPIDQPFYLGEITGLLGTEMRVGDVDVPRGHGSIQGPDLARARRLIVPITIVGPPHSTKLGDALAEVLEAFAVTPGELHWLRWKYDAQTTLRYRGRVVRRAMTTTPRAMSTGRIEFVSEILCPDPRVYGDTLKTETLTHFDTGIRGGFDVPTDLPIDMTPSVVARKNLVNNGRTVAYPYVEVRANQQDVSAFTLRNLTTGVEATFSGLDLTGGKTMICDFDGYVRAQPGPHFSIDGSSRFGTWQAPRVPFGLAPGDNLVEFDYTVGPDVATAVVSWRDTYL